MAIFSGIVVVIFSMVGAEIVTIAAAESKNPAQAIAKATNAVVSRILLFFVGSIFLLVTILPWNDAKLGDSPYVAAFEVMGIPAAADIMNAVVLTAVLSCLNSGIYTASRVLRSLSRNGDAPHSLLAVNAPRRAGEGDRGVHRRGLRRHRAAPTSRRTRSSCSS